MKLAYVDCVELVIVDVPAFLHLLPFSLSCKIGTFLHPVSFLRISSPPFSSPFHRKMDLAVNTCGQTSVSVSLCVPAFASFKTANLLSGNLCRSEGSCGSFITKCSLAIKGNGAGKVRDPAYPCMDVTQKADVINFPLHSSLGLHIRGLVVLKDGRTAGRWRISDDRTGGFCFVRRAVKSVLLLFSVYTGLCLHFRSVSNF